VKPPGNAATSSSSLSISPFLICCAVSFFIPVFACIGVDSNKWALVLLRAPEFLLLIVWLAAAIGWGSGMLKALRCRDDLPGLLRIVSSAAIGLGLMSLLVLAAGLCGWMHVLVAYSILAVGLLAGFWAREVWLIPIEPAAKSVYRWLLLLCFAALGLAFIAALLPPGLLWGDEPNGYDVLEYHLQVPREWYELGRIVPLTHNVFSYFPFNVEMHFLMAIALRGGPWSGMYLAQLMHVAFIALTVLAVYALVAERSKPMAIIAATAVATVPWMGLLAPIAYDEGGLLLWGTLAIGLSLRGSDNWRSMAIAGAMAGFACGSKLTAVPMVLLATPIVHVVVNRFRTKSILAAVSFVLAGTVIFSPWLVKNVLWIGNPVFPESTAIFGRGYWSQTQVERWIKANHLPRADQQNLPGRAAAGWNQVLADWRYGFVLLPLAVMSALARKDRYTLSAMLLLAALAMFWLFFTHLQSRFFTLSIPLAALLLGQMRAQRGEWIAYSIVVLFAGLGGLIAVYVKLTSINPHLFDIIGTQKLIGLTPLAETEIPPDARVVLVGDGRPFLYDVPSSRLSYRTVFDIDAKGNETSDEAWQAALPQWNGQTIQVIDAPELRRFSRTYWGIPAPSDDVMQMPDESVR
jgi:hypothetical protein